MCIRSAQCYKRTSHTACATNASVIYFPAAASRVPPEAKSNLSNGAAALPPIGL